MPNETIVNKQARVELLRMLLQAEPTLSKTPQALVLRANDLTLFVNHPVAAISKAQSTIRAANVHAVAARMAKPTRRSAPTIDPRERIFIRVKHPDCDDY